jgi:uncharacterized protein (DUF849 family)
MVPRTDRCPHVPVTPEAIAEDVRRCRDAGASIAHIHARAHDEEPTWDPERFREILAAVVERTPDIVLCVTTSGRTWPELEKRAAVLHLDGPVKPEMASLTLGSMNFPTGPSVNSPDTIAGLARTMDERGIVPELEVFEPGMASYANFLLRREILSPPLYVNVLLGSLGASDLSAASVAGFQAALPPGATWALAGIGRYQLQANTLAIALGGHVRVGLEDNPYYDWRTNEDASNPRLVERVVRIAREHGREPATPEETRSIIGLRSPDRLAVPAIA